MLCPRLLFSSAIRTRPPQSSVLTTTFNPFLNSSMKVFAPILFAAVALASPYFALTVETGDDELTSLRNAKTLPRTDSISAIGFTHDGDDAVFQLDGNGYLVEESLLRLQQEGVWALIDNFGPAQKDDIKGPFKVDSATREFTYVGEGNWQWSFCNTVASRGALDIYLADPSVDLTRGRTWICSSAHNLTADYEQ
ncbi:hypothetical protein B0J18DRAFT_439834 [Chaetomium sp. MPI-SDFR-AT-0129]|nr:hypothetical protein B0J18DRAFT_439834 [Chaetomium sp. MPI-SDFR-AT-0129]